MALQMKTQYERCQATFPREGPAFICTYECSFCARCTAELAHICPNCGGELVARLRPPGTPGAPGRAPAANP